MNSSYDFCFPVSSGEVSYLSGLCTLLRDNRVETGPQPALLVSLQMAVCQFDGPRGHNKPLDCVRVEYLHGPHHPPACRREPTRVYVTSPRVGGD